MTAPLRYRLTYSVLADSRLQAILKAGALLRTGVIVVEMVEAEQGNVGWWDVVLDVEETEAEPVWLHEIVEQADPITAAKAWAER